MRRSTYSGGSRYHHGGYRGGYNRHHRSNPVFTVIVWIVFIIGILFVLSRM